MSQRGGKGASKTRKVFIGIITVLLVIIVAAAAVLWFVRPDLYHTYLGVGEHDYESWETVTSNGCDEDGLRQRKCSVCGKVEKEILPATHVHNYGDWTENSAADCGKDGEKQRVCADCKTVEKQVIPATGKHSFGGWTEIIANNCGKDGERKRVCSVCNKVEAEIVPATENHTYGGWETVKENNCGENGMRSQVCAVCGDIKNESIPATGEHNMQDGVCTVCGYDPNSSVGVIEEIPQAELSIHFLELGNKYTGDCTLIKCGNTEVLIDAGSRQNSAATIKNYVDNYCTDGVLEYVIATHAHQDHIAGFVGNKSGSTRTGILYQYEIGTVIQFARHNTTSGIYNNYVSAVEYAKGNGASVYTAKECWYQTGGAKRTYYLDEAQTVSLNVLYQRFYDETTSDENDYSVCVMITHSTSGGEMNYLFTGDLEKEGEASLVESNSLPRVELFKGGHHGSYTASTDKLLSVIRPKNVAVCCCCGTTEYTTNKDNTFPAQAFIDRVGKYTANIYCTTLIEDYKAGKYTSMNGNIVFYYKKNQSGGGAVKLWCSENTEILKNTEWFKANRVWTGV